MKAIVIHNRKDSTEIQNLLENRYEFFRVGGMFDNVKYKKVTGKIGAKVKVDRIIVDTDTVDPDCDMVKQIHDNNKEAMIIGVTFLGEAKSTLLNNRIMLPVSSMMNKRIKRKK